ncbi:unnamed protein product [Effrenium voratum]|nr:unnamed protein product [Effrenium voratum]
MPGAFYAAPAVGQGGSESPLPPQPPRTMSPEPTRPYFGQPHAAAHAPPTSPQLSLRAMSPQPMLHPRSPQLPHRSVLPGPCPGSPHHPRAMSPQPMHHAMPPQEPQTLSPMTASRQVMCGAMSPHVPRSMYPVSPQPVSRAVSKTLPQTMPNLTPSLAPQWRVASGGGHGHMVNPPWAEGVALDGSHVSHASRDGREPESEPKDLGQVLEALWRRTSAFAEECTRWNSQLQEREKEASELAKMIRRISAEHAPHIQMKPEAPEALETQPAKDPAQGPAPGPAQGPAQDPAQDPVQDPAQEPPAQEQPKSQVEGPKVEVPKVEAPKVEAPKVEAPKAAAPKKEAPKAEAAKGQASKGHRQKAQATDPTAKVAAAGVRQAINILAPNLGKAAPSIQQAVELLSQPSSPGAGSRPEPEEAEVSQQQEALLADDVHETTQTNSHMTTPHTSGTLQAAVEDTAMMTPQSSGFSQAALQEAAMMMTAQTSGALQAAVQEAAVQEEAVMTPQASGTLEAVNCDQTLSEFKHPSDNLCVEGRSMNVDHPEEGELFCEVKSALSRVVGESAAGELNDPSTVTIAGWEEAREPPEPVVETPADVPVRVVRVHSAGGSTVLTQGEPGMTSDSLWVNHAGPEGALPGQVDAMEAAELAAPEDLEAPLPCPDDADGAQPEVAMTEPQEKPQAALQPPPKAQRQQSPALLGRQRRLSWGSMPKPTAPKASPKASPKSSPKASPTRKKDPEEAKPSRAAASRSPPKSRSPSPPADGTTRPGFLRATPGPSPAKTFLRATSKPKSAAKAEPKRAAA